MGVVPTSKTRLTACLKAFDTDAVVAGLKARPELLHHAAAQKLSSGIQS